MKQKIRVHAAPACKNCLGSGLSLAIFGGEHICRCVTENLEIVYYDKDYSIPGDQRYSPGDATFIHVNNLGVAEIQKKKESEND